MLSNIIIYLSFIFYLLILFLTYLAFKYNLQSEDSYFEVLMEFKIIRLVFYL